MCHMGAGKLPIRVLHWFLTAASLVIKKTLSANSNLNVFENMNGVNLGRDTSLFRKESNQEPGTVMKKENIA